MMTWLFFVALTVLARVTDAGTAIQMDQSFGPTLQGYNDLPVTTYSTVLDGVAFKSEGRYIGCGYFEVGSAANALISQYTPVGNLDTVNFNPPLGYTTLTVGGQVQCFWAQTQPADQKTVWGGVYYPVDFSSQQMLISRVTNTGSLDTGSFAAPNGYIAIEFTTTDSSQNRAYVVELQIQPTDGYIVAAGQAAQTASVEVLALVRLDPTGVLDPAFGSGGQVTQQVGDTISANTGVVIQSDGNIVASAMSFVSGVPQIAIARFTTSGVLDATYGGGAGFIQYPMSEESYSIGMDIQKVGANQDKILIAAVSAPSAQVFVLRFNTDGSLDTSFGSAGFATINLPTGSQPGVTSISVVNDTSDNILVSGDYGTPLGGGYLIKLTADGTTDSTFGDYPTAISGLLTITDIAQAEPQSIYASQWDQNSNPIIVGSIENVAGSDMYIERFLPTNAQFVTIVSPVAGEGTTTNPQIYLNGGSSQANSLVQVLIDDVLVFSPITNSRGNWEAGMSAPLASGTHTVTANMIYDVDTIVATASTTVTIA